MVSRISMLTMSERFMIKHEFVSPGCPMAQPHAPCHKVQTNGYPVSP